MTKRALVLSGGGAKGAYQIGVLKALIEKGHRWDVVCGVSVGALNASLISMYDKRNQDKAVSFLEKVWVNEIKEDKDVFKPWLPWYFTFLPALWKGSLYSTKPLKKLITKNWTQPRVKDSDVDLYVGAVNLNTGYYETVDHNDENILDFILASASFPIAFPPVKIRGHKYTDGGVRNAVPIAEAIAAGATEIDIVMTAPPIPTMDPKGDGVTKTLVHVAMRVAEALADEVYITDLHQMCEAEGIKWNLWAPSGGTGVGALEFSEKDVKRLIEQGYKATK